MVINVDIQKGLYRHYKGNLYEVHMVAKHSETEELMVVYKALYGTSGMWVRPYSMFIEEIELNGKLVKRFSFIGDG